MKRLAIVRACLQHTDVGLVFVCVFTPFFAWAKFAVAVWNCVISKWQVFRKWHDDRVSGCYPQEQLSALVLNSGFCCNDAFCGRLEVI
jgi:hypothetical protein